MNKWFNVYSKLPVFAQNTACSVAGIKMRRERYGEIFREAYCFLQKSEWWKQEEIERYQNKEVKKILSHAYNSVPYYRRIMDECGIDVEGVRSIDELANLPILTKETVRSEYASMLSELVSEKDRVAGKTGGTTGTALKLAAERTTQQWQWAVWWRHRSRFGISLHDSFIVFAGRDVVPYTTMKPPFWRRNILLHQTYVSIHHITNNNLPVLAEYLCKRRVKYYSGYPSSLYIIANYLLSKNIKLPSPPQMTFTGAETLLPHQKDVIQKGFSTIVSDQYGASEYCCNISQCEYFKYHVDVEYGYVEFIPIPGMPKNVRRVIATGFKNMAMPLIRYDIGDIVTVSNEKCACGRVAPVVEKIDGRIESYVVTPDGRYMGRLDFLFKESAHIKEAQIIQNELSTVLFKVVTTSDYLKEDEDKFIHLIHTYMGTSFKINIEYVDSIPREKNGKFRQIVSTIFKNSIANIA